MRVYFSVAAVTGAWKTLANVKPSLAQEWTELSQDDILPHDVSCEAHSPDYCILLFAIWRDSREVKCVVHTPMIESSIPCLRKAVCVRMSSYLTIAPG